MALGPLMLDVDGLSLSSQDCELLKHPTVGGVILFSRNYQSVTQLQNLCAQIHELREPRLLIAVDQEGGRVQRFREEFCKLPPAENYGDLYDSDSQSALNLVSEAGWLVASELRACGLDINFAPILDLKLGRSQVIGGRAFHCQTDAVTRLARAFNRGMAEAGMQAVGKHFPGHGWVAEDSHSELPVDTRSFADMELQDLVPFERLARDGIAGIMTGHLRIPSVDEVAVSFSKRWLSNILREQLNFQGAIFSDDLSMHGAQGAGDPVERASMALSAGCDMVLFCNDREGAVQIVSKLTYDSNPMRSARLARLHGQGDCQWRELQLDQRYVMLKAKLEAMDVSPELNLQNDTPA